MKPRGIGKWTITGTILIVFGSMLVTVENYSLSIPFFDEWGAEAVILYKNYENGELVASDLFLPHNGHRIVLTRLTALVLYIINGGWDPQVQMIINALLHAILCAVLVRIIFHRLQSGTIFVLPVVLTILLFSVPFSWMSITVAFQSQFYFMALFSILALHYLTSSRFILGSIYSLLAMLSMTPGAFVLPAFAGATLVSALQSRTLNRIQAFLCIVSILLFIVFVLTLREEPTAQALHAQHIPGFFYSLLHTISWPFSYEFGVGLIVHVPFALYLIQSASSSRGSSFLLALGVFVAFQILAMAYFRGSDGVLPANRYWEILIIGLWVNGICTYSMARHRNTNFTKRFALVWLFVAAIGLSAVGYQSFSEGLPNRKADGLTAQSLILEFLGEEDRDIFLGRSPFEVSHPDIDALVALLQDEQIQELLPSSLGGNSQDRLLPMKTLLFAMSPVMLVLGIISISYSTVKYYSFLSESEL